MGILNVVSPRCMTALVVPMPAFLLVYFFVMTFHSSQNTPSQEDFILVNAFALIMPVKVPWKTFYILIKKVVMLLENHLLDFRGSLLLVTYHIPRIVSEWHCYVPGLYLGCGKHRETPHT